MANIVIMVLCSSAIAAMIGSAQGQCPDSSWTYYYTTGSCYQVTASVSVSYTYSQAVSNCLANNSRLLSIDSDTEQLIIDNMLQYNYVQFWVGVTYNSTLNQWMLADGWPNNYTSRWYPGNPDVTLPCTTIYKNVAWQNTPYQTQTMWFSTSCSNSAINGYICEYEGPRCPSVPTVANATASGWQNYYQQTVTYTCNDGFIIPMYLNGVTGPTSSSDGSTTTAGSTSFYFQQSMTCVNSTNNYTWTPDASTMVACVPKYCTSPPTSYDTTQMKIYPACDICANVQSSYIGGTLATYTCQSGFKVPYGNSTTLQVNCGTDPYNVLANTWKPQSVACTPVQCPGYLSFMPSNSAISGTDYQGNTIRKGASQLYTQWGTKMTFTCNAGFIYSDNQLLRTYQCNAISTVGYWTLITPSNAQFTVAGCNPVQCANWSSIVSQAISSNWTYVSSGDYMQTAYNSQFTLSCATGSAFADSSTSKTFVCGTSQLWTVNGVSYQTVPSCIQSTGSGLDLPTNGQQYQPPSVDSPQAANNAAVVFALTGVVMALIIIMDIAVIPRDIGILKWNLQRLRERCGGKQADDQESKALEENYDAFNDSEAPSSSDAAPMAKISL